MQNGPTLLSEHLPVEIRGDETRDVPTFSADIAFETGLEEALAEFEKKIILSALKSCSSNVLQAAQLLKIPRGTLRYKMEKLGLG